MLNPASALFATPAPTAQPPLPMPPPAPAASGAPRFDEALQRARQSPEAAARAARESAPRSGGPTTGHPAGSVSAGDAAPPTRATAGAPTRAEGAADPSANGSGDAPTDPAEASGTGAMPDRSAQDAAAAGSRGTARAARGPSGLPGRPGTPSRATDASRTEAGSTAADAATDEAGDGSVSSPTGGPRTGRARAGADASAADAQPGLPPVGTSAGLPPGWSDGAAGDAARAIAEGTSAARSGDDPGPADAAEGVGGPQGTGRTARGAQRAAAARAEEASAAGSASATAQAAIDPDATRGPAHRGAEASSQEPGGPASPVASGVPNPATPAGAGLPGDLSSALRAVNGLSDAPPAAAPTGSAAAAAGSPSRPADIDAPIGSPGFGPALGARVAMLARDGIDRARLHVSPAELGPVALQLSLDGTQLRVDMVADAAATRQALEQSLPALASSLRDAGFTLAGGGVFPSWSQGEGSSRGSAGSSGSGGDGGARDPGAGSPGGRSADGTERSAAPVVRRLRDQALVDLYA